MAAKDSDKADITRQELNDITTCCICTEVYTDPKALPCIHTFCMNCLQECGLKSNKGPGDEMPCPICRRMFKIPSEGFHGLPKNFFIENLIQVANLSNQSVCSGAVCDSCLDENKDEVGKEIPTAAAYCIDCKCKLCEECSSEHQNFKFTKNHKLISMTEHEAGQSVMTHLYVAPNVCELHEQKVLDVYCAECKTVLCAMCFIEGHKNHEGSDVKKFVDGFRKQIEINTVAINECRSKAEMRKAEILKVKEDTQKMIESLECEVGERKEELRQSTENHAVYLLQGLSVKKQSKLKEIQMETDDIDTYLTSLETYSSYCQKMIAEGSANDICGAFSDLSVRAVELQEQCQPMIERKIQSFNFCFRKLEIEQFLEECGGSLFGEIEEEGGLKPTMGRKDILLAEQSNEIDILRKEIEIAWAEKESLHLSNDQLKLYVDKEIQANKSLQEELEKEKVNCIENLNKIKTANSTLQANNDKLKQELHAISKTRNSLQWRIDQLKQELGKEKIANNSLETDNDKLKQDLDNETLINNSIQKSSIKLVQEVKELEDNIAKLRQELESTKNDSANKMSNLEKKLEQEQSEKEVLIIKQTEEMRRLRGELRYKLDPVFVQTIRTKAAEEKKKLINGLTILDKELFVVSGESSEVEVYDSMTFSFSRRWRLKEIIFDPCTIASCIRNKCLYISDFKVRGQSSEILRVDPNGKLIKNWSTGDDEFLKLAVTDESNVILTVYEKNKLKEYSPVGQLIREIFLSSEDGIRHPHHTIKLTNGQLVVSHGNGDDALHRVCIVDKNGKLKKSLGGKCGSNIGQLNCPVHLSVDGNGFMLVADFNNSRVLLLNPDLEFKREILSKEGKHGLRNPSRILLDETNDRLFVADHGWDFGKQIFTGGRILVFDLK